MFIRIAGVLAILVMTGANASAADCSNGPIAATPVKGVVVGHPFTPTYNTIDTTPGQNTLNDVKLDEYNLAFASDDQSTQIKMVLAVRAGTRLDGKTFRMTGGGDSNQPSVAPGIPEIQGWDLSAGAVSSNFVDEPATLRVELGTRLGKTISGKIHFCAVKSKTDISGTFTATGE